jgi:hypothetical protein
MKSLVRGEREVLTPEKRERIIQDCIASGFTRSQAEYTLCEEMEQEIWVNDIYQVEKRPAQEGVVWLSIKRHDKQDCHDWRHFQEIKNQLVGPECEAVELYPAESRVIDTANQYHLWVFQDPTLRLPFGFHNGRHVTYESTQDRKQRGEEG